MNRYTLPIAVHVLLLRAGSVLLIERAGTGFEDGRLGLPAGHLEPGEPVTHAAVRECREEIGIHIDPADLRPLGATHFTSPSGAGVDFFFTAARWAGEPRPLAECRSVGWYPMNDLPDQIIPFVRRAIEKQLLGGVWFDEDGWN